MLAYIIRRLLTVIPVVLGVILLTFVLFRMVGGNPAERIAGKNATPLRIAEISHQNGYFKPKIFGFWSTELFQEDSVEGVLSTKLNDASVFLFKPTSGKVALPLSVLDPSYEVLYRLDFRIKAPQGGTVRVYRDLAGVQAEPNQLLVEKPLTPSQRAQAVSVQVTTPPQEKAPETLTDASVPTRLAVAFRIEFEGREATVSAVEMRSRQRSSFDSQLKDMLFKLAAFDFGESKETKQRVSAMLLSGLGPSLSITVPAFLMGILLAISISLVCAYYRNSWLDRTLVVIAVIGMSINVLVYCIFLQNWTAETFQYYGLPVWGFESWRYLLLPVFIAVAGGLGGSVRFYRTIMLNERYQDYIRTAQAKGCNDGVILFRHVLKNAMIPILTTVVIEIPFLYTGALLLENFFGIPGLGYMTVQAIQNGDEPVIFASVFIGSIIFVIANLLTDLSYAVVDPRIRLK